MSCSEHTASALEPEASQRGTSCVQPLCAITREDTGASCAQGCGQSSRVCPQNPSPSYLVLRSSP